MTDFQFVILVVPYMRRRNEQVALAGSDPTRWTVLMDQIRTQMQFAESVGYDGFAMTEQHCQVEGIETTTNPLFWDYFVAQHTERMRVGQLGMNLTVPGEFTGRLQYAYPTNADAAPTDGDKSHWWFDFTYSF